MLSEIFELRIGIFLVLNAQTGGWEKAMAFRSTWVGGPSHRWGCNINCPSRRLTLLLTLLGGRFCKC